MFRKKKLNIDDMTAMELRALHDGIMRELMWKNGLWLLFVVVMLFVWLTAGVILVILTVLKYTYDYFDTDAQALNADIIATIFKRRFLRKVSKSAGTKNETHHTRRPGWGAGQWAGVGAR